MKGIPDMYLRAVSASLFYVFSGNENGRQPGDGASAAFCFCVGDQPLLVGM